MDKDTRTWRFGETRSLSCLIDYVSNDPNVHRVGFKILRRSILGGNEGPRDS